MFIAEEQGNDKGFLQAEWRGFDITNKRFLQLPAELQEKFSTLYVNFCMTIEEAASYSSIGISKIEELSKRPKCNFVLYIGRKTWLREKSLTNISVKILNYNLD